METDLLDVLIVGAGVSGIGMACTLSTACPGKTYVVLERRQRLGGTWDLFDYPGVRSDSDMLTYGYKFRPWQGAKVLADGPVIRDYLADTARAFGIDRHIRYGLKITAARWSAVDQLWTVDALAEPGDERRTWRARQLVMCTGYYDHDAGYTPELPGIERFSGRRVHPQHWPRDLDVSGQRVVVMGSGATAITLVPALARTAAHVTMLQRSPTYVLSVPAHDHTTERLSRWLPRRWAFAIARRRNTVLAHWLYVAARKWPQRVRKLLLDQVAKHLAGSADIAHFTPSYMPWDQRLCIVPDADLFAAIRSGRAGVATDQVAGFDGRTLVLRSGGTLEADVLVTATGLAVQVFGGIAVSVDGRPYAPHEHMLYKGVLMEDLPNCAWIVGSNNVPWTLKADLAAGYLCRLYKYLDSHRLAVFHAHDDAANRTADSIMGNLHSGYIIRAHAVMPRQGRDAPWRVTHHYPTDKRVLMHSPIADGVLRFEPAQAARKAA